MGALKRKVKGGIERQQYASLFLLQELSVVLDSTPYFHTNRERKQRHQIDFGIELPHQTRCGAHRLWLQKPQSCLAREEALRRAMAELQFLIWVKLDRIRLDGSREHPQPRLLLEGEEGNSDETSTSHLSGNDGVRGQL